MLLQYILERIALLDVITYRHMLALPSIARFSQLKQFWLQKYFTQVYYGEYKCEDKRIYFIINKYIPHCVDGKPAKITRERTKMWYKNGQNHRENGPAMEFINGDKFWCINNNFHRIDGPARYFSNGTKEWFRNGKLDRDDGPAIEWNSGEKEWYKNDKRHRDDGPAIEWPDGFKSWYQNGELHRDNNEPAIIYPNGSKEWWINGVNQSSPTKL